MKLRHPSRAKLAAWLDGSGAAELDSHLANCDRCASKIESLADPQVDLRQALTFALRPPDDLVPRLQSGVRKRLDGRQDLNLLGQMLGLPWQTVRILMDEEPQ